MNETLIFSKYVVCSKGAETEDVFPTKEMNNEINVIFLKNTSQYRD